MCFFVSISRLPPFFLATAGARTLFYSARAQYIPNIMWCATMYTYPDHARSNFLAGLAARRLRADGAPSARSARPHRPVRPVRPLCVYIWSTRDCCHRHFFFGNAVGGSGGVVVVVLVGGGLRCSPTNKFIREICLLFSLVVRKCVCVRRRTRVNKLHGTARNAHATSGRPLALRCIPILRAPPWAVRATWMHTHTHAACEGEVWRHSG